jgi:hypothetical protein
MMETSKTNFVKQYEPGKQARVELKNGRILDVVNGRYYDEGTRVILRNGKIDVQYSLSFSVGPTHNDSRSARSEAH